MIQIDSAVFVLLLFILKFRYNFWYFFYVTISLTVILSPSFQEILNRTFVFEVVCYLLHLNSQ